MTRFFIDNREIAPPIDMSSLDLIVKHVQSTHLPANSVVRKIRVDGLPVISPDDSDRIPVIFDQIDKKQTVEIFTGTLTEIAAESIAEALSYLDRIESATPSLAESFRFCPGPGSFENLRQLCEGFYWLNMLLDKLESNFHVSLDAVVIEGVSAPQYHKKFISILKQLVESQESGDLVLISDLLEYEIVPFVAVWRDILRAVSAKIAMTQ